MSDNPGYGFVPSPNSPKKELPEVPRVETPVVNNYSTVVNDYSTVVNNDSTIAIDPQAILFMLLFAILLYLAVRLVSTGLQA
jgi:hypothetical protein